MSKSKKKVHTLIEDAVVELSLPEEMQASAPVDDAAVQAYVDAIDAIEEAADDVGESEEAADEAVEAMPFVKLAKDQLPERGTPEREAYRKARRAAARAARKARVAA
jgi:hypothetical protein